MANINGTFPTSGPAVIREIPSSAISATATTANFSPLAGQNFQMEIGVLSVSGAAAQLLATIQESVDPNFWVDVYKYPPITAPGGYRSPILPRRGTAYRVRQVISGTTPSFTRHIDQIRLDTDLDIALTSRRTGAFNLLNTGFDIPLYGRTRRLAVSNRTGLLHFLQFHNSATPLVAGAIPLAAEVYHLPANATLSLGANELGELGTVFGADPRLAISTTFATYTPVTLAPANSFSYFVETL